MLAPVRLATAPEPLQAAQLRVLLWKVVLAAILSIRRIARSQRLMRRRVVQRRMAGLQPRSWSSWDWQGDHQEWEDRRGYRQGRDDYYEGDHSGGSHEDRRGWDDYYESGRWNDYNEDRRRDYHYEDRHEEYDRSGWQDWNDRDDQDDEWYGRARWRSRRRLPRQSALAYKSGSSSKKQLFADEELLALVPVSDRSSFGFESSVEERPALVRLVDGPGSTSRGFVWGALCFAAAGLSSTRDVVLLGLRCLWCLSAAVRNRLAHSLNGNQDGLYPWILCGIISLATYRVGEEFADGAAAVVRVTTEVIEDVFETTSVEVQETIQWVGMFARTALVVAVWYVGRTCWSKLMHVLHGNTTAPTKGPTETSRLGGFSLMNQLRLDRLGFVLVWPWKAPRRFIRSKEAMELLIGLCCMTQTRVRSGVVARLTFSQESIASIWSK